MANKKVKLVNPNPFAHGLKLMDGIREINIAGGSFTLLDEDEVYFINSVSRTFSHKHLLIADPEINQALGYAEKPVIGLSDEEIKTLLRGTINKIKDTLVNVTEKHEIDRVIDVAKGMEDLQRNKITYLQEWSGYDFDQLVDTGKEEK
ncbi:hypothetical protein [Paenibacillus cremeus]|uniref:Uncharacterized protein n=1 Tax=Paenibacillus cremeus TaxID=2163881 RepID=A0A559KCX5_9BACL|nr:hypothetical protein [Paenibacillus cremeus]TVY09965.1 hypothetical protein FPZ49_11380 [Paenibacillus cremeus]